MTETNKQYKPRQPKKANVKGIDTPEYTPHKPRQPKKANVKGIDTPEYTPHKPRQPKKANVKGIDTPEYTPPTMPEIKPAKKSIKDYACYHCVKASVITKRGMVMCGGGFLPIRETCQGQIKNG